MKDFLAVLFIRFVYAMAQGFTSVHAVSSSPDKLRQESDEAVARYRASQEAKLQAAALAIEEARCNALDSQPNNVIKKRAEKLTSH